MSNLKVNFSIKSLPHNEILHFLEKNDNAHYKKLSKIVDLDSYAKKLSEQAMHFTLYDKEKLIGFCACYFNDDITKVGYISGITFLDGYRGIGLGGKMLKHVIEYGKQNLFKEIHINPECQNSVLIHFFIKNGFDIHERVNGRCLLKYMIEENV